MWLKRMQLGLIHVAVAITLVPINSTLNRIMIKELAISAALVAIFVSLPYLVSPIQVAIGSYADRHPILGRRRTPYILLGLLLCVGGAVLAPTAAFALAEQGLAGVLLALLAFGMWGMGYNLSAVSYLSLASEIDPGGRSRTIATMFFMMITGIIVMAIAIGRIVDPYTPEALFRAFYLAGGVALALGLLGLIGLEKPYIAGARADEKRHTWGEMVGAVLANQQARLFFWYLILLLAAILGQDVLLEPYAGEAFGLTPAQTTRITSIWGTCVLITLALANLLQARTSKRTVVKVGNWGALGGFVLIAASGVAGSSVVFYSGVVLLGLGTGFATVSNLSLMLDMTTPQNIGLFIGAWGVANAMSRLIGQVLSGALRDVVALAVDSPVTAYVVVFVVQALFLAAALIMLRGIDVGAFRAQAEQRLSFAESAALMHEAQGS
jgi:BCD family chlorophyll transporter-like MFS transporter